MLYILCGIPFSGKSPLRGYPHIDLHDERRVVSRFAAKHHTTFKTIFVDIPVALARQRLALNRKQQVRFNLTDQEFASAVQEMEPPTYIEHVLLYDGTRPPQEWLKTHNI